MLFGLQNDVILTSKRGRFKVLFRLEQFLLDSEYSNLFYVLVVNLL
jgi:hypothetical protein